MFLPQKVRNKSSMRSSSASIADSSLKLSILFSMYSMSLIIVSNRSSKGAVSHKRDLKTFISINSLRSLSKSLY